MNFVRALRASLGCLGLIIAAVGYAQRPITVTVLHTNDLHAHIEPTPVRGKLYGGFAQHATVIKQVRAKEKNVLLLNAGDVFQGTLYFNIYEGLADVLLMNELGYQAMCVGNHEFDKGPGPLSEFAKRATFPLLACNLDTSQEPRLASLIKPYTVVTLEGQKVGIIGLITESTPGISSPGDTVAFNNLQSSAQATVDTLTKQGINKIILLTHIGYVEDRLLATKLRGVDLIVGGHSHTPLGTPALDGWRPSGGPYPTKAVDAEGLETLIVQAWEWGKVMGKIKVSFDARGRITKVFESTPMVIDSNIQPDARISAIIDAFKKPVEAMGSATVGESSVAMTDRFQVGMHMADALLQSTERLGAVAAFLNPGGVRSNLEKGKISYGAASSVAPFRNTLVLVELSGADITQMINDVKGNLIPSRGAGFTLAGGGAREVMIAGKPINQTEIYKIAVLNFMADGGDGLITLKNSVKKQDTGILDIDSFVDYIKLNSPLQLIETLRIKR